MAEYNPITDVYTEVVDAELREEFTFIKDVKLQEKTATANGIIVPDTGKDGLSKVTVAVPNTYTAEDEGKVVSEGALVAQGSQTITQNGTYDTTLKNEIVVNVSGGGGGNANVVFHDYYLFNGGGYITLPYAINSDYRITVDFDALEYFSNQAVIGNTSSASYVHLTQYNNKWYTSSGNIETNFTAQTTGRHVYVSNKDGSNYFDDVAVTSYNPISLSNRILVLGGRPVGGGKNFTGKIYSYKIESISTGDVIMELVPATFEYEGETMLAGLYDTVSKQVYTAYGAICGDDE